MQKVTFPLLFRKLLAMQEWESQIAHANHITVVALGFFNQFAVLMENITITCVNLVVPKL